MRARPAAASLYVTQPALSQAVQLLERTMGTALFDHSAREVRLTAAGLALVGPARQVGADLAAAAAAVAAVAAVERGVVTIAAPPELAVDPLVRLCAAFRSAHPGVQIEISDIDRPVADLVRGRSREVVLAFLPVDAPGAVTVELGARRLQLVVPGDSRPGRGPVTVGGLADVDLVSGPPGTAIRDLVDDRLAAAGREPRVVVEVRREERIGELVAAGAGSAVLPEWSARIARAAGVRVMEFDEPWVQRFGLVHAASGLTPAGAAFVEAATRHP
ncbi:LysR family transcriptional regulator [Actinomadura roseirufa]|uniref:LysR family transcriptional regulator n=1 Tax=Actinomadura roseirufa TaxID=2094049 RepID=UPI0013F15930|nr:LysR family transcriptional regulator [Actinomadura roseirufa]